MTNIVKFLGSLEVLILLLILAVSIFVSMIVYYLAKSKKAAPNPSINGQAQSKLIKRELELFNHSFKQVVNKIEDIEAKMKAMALDINKAPVLGHHHMQHISQMTLATQKKSSQDKHKFEFKETRMITTAEAKLIYQWHNTKKE